MFIVFGHKGVVELLIAKGADVNAKDGIGGKTTLGWGKSKISILCEFLSMN